MCAFKSYALRCKHILLPSVYKKKTWAPHKQTPQSPPSIYGVSWTLTERQGCGKPQVILQTQSFYAPVPIRGTLRLPVFKPRSQQLPWPSRGCWHSHTSLLHPEHGDGKGLLRVPNLSVWNCTSHTVKTVPCSYCYHGIREIISQVMSPKVPAFK